MWRHRIQIGKNREKELCRRRVWRRVGREREVHGRMNRRKK
jgi:hypothetical protein